MNNWNELSVKVSRETEEAVSNMLIEAGAQGVAIEDTQDYLNNVDHFGEILPDVVQLDTIIIKAYKEGVTVCTGSLASYPYIILPLLIHTYSDLNIGCISLGIIRGIVSHKGNCFSK